MLRHPLTRDAHLHQLNQLTLQHIVGVSDNSPFGQLEVYLVQQLLTYLLAERVLHLLLNPVLQPFCYELAEGFERTEPAGRREFLINLRQNAAVNLMHRQLEG